MNDLDLYADKETVERKTKLRAYAITIDNTFGREPALIYHEEKVFLEVEKAGTAAEKTKRTGAQQVGELRIPASEVLPAAHVLSTGQTVTGAEVAEWFMRDYVARKTAQEAPQK